MTIKKYTIPKLSPLNPLIYFNKLAIVRSKKGNLIEVFKKLNYKSIEIINSLGHKRLIYYHFPEQTTPKKLLFVLTGIGGLSLKTRSVNSTNHYSYFSTDLSTTHDEPWADSVIIVLENSLSYNWIENNKTVLFSTIEAGWDLYYTLKAINKHTIFKAYNNNSSMIGISLGGNDSICAMAIAGLKKSPVITHSLVTISASLNRYQDLSFYISWVKKIKHTYGMIGTIANAVESFWKDRHRNTFHKDLIHRMDTAKMMKNYFHKESIYQMESHLKNLKSFITKHQLISPAVGKLSLKQYMQLYKLDKLIDHIKVPITNIHAVDDPVVSFDIAKDTAQLLQTNCKHNLFKFLYTAHGSHGVFTYCYGKRWTHHFLSTYLWKKVKKTDRSPHPEE